MTLWTNGHEASQTTVVLDLRTKRDRGAGCGRLEGQPARGRTLTHTMPLGSGVRVCACVGCMRGCGAGGRAAASRPKRTGFRAVRAGSTTHAHTHTHTPALMPQALIVLCYQIRLLFEKPWFNADLLLFLFGLGHVRSLFQFVKSTSQQKQTEAP